MVTSFLDISDRIEAEQRLKEMNRLKSELLRRASHELRTPLTSINGAVELLLTIYKKDFDETTEEFLNIIKKGGKRLENLIKDLLNVSTLQTHIIEIIKRRENIVKIIFDSIDEIKIFASEREINIIFNQEERIYINVDKNKILQVFMNLIMNAIKYTPPKGVVSIKIETHTEDLIDIIIKDTGIGFTEEEKKIVFKQFGKIERFGQGFDVNTEGSGLGLYISKELVELHSGKLWVESEGRNKGSSFIIRLPKF
jgi:two-component system phosphate regulon sensor histidine kinase PhoR